MLLQRIDMESPTRRVTIDEKYHQRFWNAVTSIASNRRAEYADDNPFLTIHLSDIIIDTIIALSNAVESNDQEKIQQFRTAARGGPLGNTTENTSSSPFNVKQRTILLYINESKRTPFWNSMMTLGKRVLSIRGRKSPFEFVNISALIVGTFLDLGGHEVSLDDQIVQPFAMKKTLTFSVPQEIRKQFWQNLLLIATRKHSHLHALDQSELVMNSAKPTSELFRGIDRSELIINLVINLAKALSTKDTSTILIFADESTDITLPDGLSFEQDPGATSLVISVHTRFRAPFWEAMNALGEQELNRQVNNSPFRGASTSTIITNTVLAIGHIIKCHDWKRFSDLTGIDPSSATTVDVPILQ